MALSEDDRQAIRNIVASELREFAFRALWVVLVGGLSGQPHFKAPTQPERRERLLQELVRKARKPVVLFIDEAHDIHGHTLNGLKRLMELVTAGGGKLSVVLVGHPRLQNDLRRATMEEIGDRTSKFDFVALGDQRREFVRWLLETCLEDGVDPDSVIAPQAQDFLVERLSTPLQFAEHLNRAFTDAFHLGAETVTREIVENTLSAGFDSLDAKLARIGYTPKALAERFDAHPAEIRRFLNGRLDPERTAELGASDPAHRDDATVAVPIALLARDRPPSNAP